MGARIRPRDLDALTELPWPRVQVAAHELGHWLVWRTVPRVRVRSVRIWGSDRNPRGEVHIDWSKTGDTTEIDKAYLIGLLAGEEADKLWAAATKIPRMRGGAGHDMAVFRKVRRRHEPSRQWSESHLRSCARSYLTSNWNDLAGNVAHLARTGRL